MDRGDFLLAMRQIASSVAVVTTDGDHGKHGATASSFCSVSADPPSMLVCLHDDSRIAGGVRRNGRFCINVLPQDAPQIAEQFAGRHDDGLDDRFEGIEHAMGVGGCPSLTGAVSFHCLLKSDHLSGSHRVMIGEVEQIEGTIEGPLTYMDGAYRPLDRVVP